jgi:hypothetical protein
MMHTRIIEAVQDRTTPGNWGKFLVARFAAVEWAAASAVTGAPLLPQLGWTPQHLWVLDLQTGEGALFRPGGLATYDLERTHQIWTCPLFPAFLTWLYTQDLRDLAALPALVELPDAPFAFYGQRGARAPAGGAAP